MRLWDAIGFASHLLPCHLHADWRCRMCWSQMHQALQLLPLTQGNDGLVRQAYFHSPFCMALVVADLMTFFRRQQWQTLSLRLSFPDHLTLPRSNRLCSRQLHFSNDLTHQHHCGSGVGFFNDVQRFLQKPNLGGFDPWLQFASCEKVLKLPGFKSLTGGLDHDTKNCSEPSTTFQ